MAKRQPASKPFMGQMSKRDSRAFDRLGLLELIRDIDAAHKDNQAFLHARFGLGADVLSSTYKETLDRWLLAGCLANTRTRPSSRPNTPSPATEKLLANRPVSRS